MERLLLRVGEAADLLGVGKSTAYELVASGEIPSVRIGGKGREGEPGYRLGTAIRVPAEELKRWVEKVARKKGTGARE